MHSPAYPSPLYNLQYVLFSIHSPIYILHYTFSRNTLLYIFQCTLSISPFFNIHSPLYILQYTLFIIHSPVYTLHFPFFDIRSPLHILQYTLFIIQYVLQYTLLQYTLLQYTLSRIHSPVYPPYYTSFIIHSLSVLRYTLSIFFFF